MTREDMQQVCSEYGQAAKNAVKAGFDGIEIHSANGYLVDQFLCDNSTSVVLITVSYFVNDYQ